MLSCAGLSDEAALAHAQRQQRLPQAIVDLMRAGVEQIFPFEIDAQPPKRLAEPLGWIEWSRTPGVTMEIVAQLAPEPRITLRRMPRSFQFLQGSHDRFRDKFPPKRPKMACAIRHRVSLKHG